MNEFFGAGNVKLYGAEKESLRGKAISSDCCYMVIPNLYMVMLLSSLSKGYFSGIKIIKTETIEAIHEKDEGSMQNVGMSMTELYYYQLESTLFYFSYFSGL